MTITITFSTFSPARSQSDFAGLKPGDLVALTGAESGTFMVVAAGDTWAELRPLKWWERCVVALRHMLDKVIAWAERSK